MNHIVRYGYERNTGAYCIAEIVILAPDQDVAKDIFWHSVNESNDSRFSLQYATNIVEVISNYDGDYDGKFYG